MMMVFAFGISRPLSMMVVESSTSASPLTNVVITSSSSSASIWPWPTTMRACGSSVCNFARIVSIVITRLCRKKTCPPRFSSRWMASRITRSSYCVDDGLDRQPVVRRRLDGAHVPRAGEREVERARNRRGAEREHVHQRAQLLELFLVQHAEPLLLVNHHQPQILERDVVLQQAGACR